MRVVVTRPEPEAGAWVQALRRAGFDALALPLLAITPPADAAPAHAAWAQLGTFRAAMFVSGNAVRQFFELRPAPCAWPEERTRAWAPGPGTAAALQAAGVPQTAIDAPAADAQNFDSEELWRVVHPQVGAGDRVLLVRGGGEDGQARGRNWLAERVRERGATVESVVSYTRGSPSWTAEQLAQARAALAGDAVWLFSSSEGVAQLPGLLPGADASRTDALVTHARIADAVLAAGFRDVQLCTPTLDAVIASLQSRG